MKWLITGGCGFIGTSLIRKLIQSSESHQIRVLDDLSVGKREDLKKVCEFRELKGDAIYSNMNICKTDSVELIVGDIRDELLALKVTKDIDVVVHLAANTGVGPSVENPRLDCMVNVIGTFNYLEGARQNKVPKFIFASSGAPAGEVEPPIHEELPPHPVSPYGASKLAGEGYCSAYSRSFGINTVMLRFGNVYGPGSIHKSSVVAKFINKALNGEALEIYGDGNQTRDFIFINDLIGAVLLAVNQKDIGGEAFQIATSRETTVSEIALKIKEILNQKGINDSRVVNSEERLGDVKRNFSDTRKAKNHLGWESLVDLDEGLRHTIEYFLDQHRHRKV